MRFAALFFDDINPSSLDPALTSAHFDYLRVFGAAITSAGGLKTAPDGRFCGSLWVIEADNLEAARKLVDDDPYCRAGLRPDRTVYIWNHAPIPAAAPQ
jgi:uncharacterized protein YciI